MANQIDARIQLKIDTQENWEVNAPDFIPKLGELIIYSPDEKHSVPRFKVGDGSNYLYDLPFSNDELILKNGSPSYWSSPANANFIPKEGQIVVINASSNSPASIKIGDGKTSVKNLSTFGDAGNSNSAALSLVNEAGNPLNRGNTNNFVYFENGVPMPSDIYVWESVPADAKFTDTTYEPVSNTGTKAGLMSVEDKKALDNLAENAIIKTNYASKDSWGIVKIGNNLNISNGILSAADQTIPSATTTVAGLMSAEDKIKLNNIEAEANKTIIDSTLSSTSTNPVENKVINSEITKLGTLISEGNSTTLASAKTYTNNKIADLIGGAPDTLDTLEEIATAMENNPDVIDVLHTSIGTKANSSDLNAHKNNTSNPHNVTASQVGLGNVENKSVATIKEEILTKTNLKTLGVSFSDTTYNEFTGADAGLVPSSNGEEDKYLAADGEWKTITIPEYTAPVTSVNGETGAVTITAESLGALTEVPNNYVTKTFLDEQNYASASDIPTSTQISKWNTAYTHANNKGSAFSSGLYKITTNSQGHITAATAVEKTDITNLGIPSSDTTYSTATSTSLGLVKIGYAQSGKNYPVQLSNGQMYVNVPWTDSDTTYNNATTSAAGLMSTSDKIKLNSIASNANNYILPSANSSTLGGVKIGNHISVDSAGLISLSKQNVTDALGYTPPKTDTTYNAATTSSSGLMTSDMVTKLSGIESGANKTTIDSALSSTSTNPVQNKIINSALANKIGSTSISSINVVSSLPSSGTSGILYLVRN